MDYNITTGKDGDRSFISIYHDGKRYRFSTGKAVGLKLNAVENLELLRSAFELKLREGWRPKRNAPIKADTLTPTFLEVLDSSCTRIQNGNYSDHHKRDCRWVLNEWCKYSKVYSLNFKKPEEIRIDSIREFVFQPKWSRRTQKNVLTTIRILAKEYVQLKDLKAPKVNATLHKPIKNISLLLEEIKNYNSNLYLACLLTYSCLLRPHQEVRNLNWSDIDFERNIISLSGNRNKSGRNRIVPMTDTVRKELSSRYKSKDENVLSGRLSPYSNDYLKTLWRRFKKQSKRLDKGVTLYSFRHSGAIHVFEKTGSLIKLQQVMGHSDMKVSLTYLRGLEINQIKGEDLPTVDSNFKN